MVGNELDTPRGSDPLACAVGIRRNVTGLGEATVGVVLLEQYPLIADLGCRFGCLWWWTGVVDRSGRVNYRSHQTVKGGLAGVFVA